ncbi:MAG: hypothetical protein QHC77_17905, partial [Stenotrophomonas sp.]
MSAQLDSDVRGIGDDIERGLALFGNQPATRIGPDKQRKAGGAGLLAHDAQLLGLADKGIRTGVERESYRRAVEAHSVVHGRDDRLILDHREAVGGVQLEDRGNLSG